MNIITQYAQTFKARCATATLLVATVAAQAHPGHSLHDESTMHYVTSPYHLLVLALGGVILCGTAVLVKHVLARRLLATGGVLALLAAVVLWQMPS